MLRLKDPHEIEAGDWCRRCGGTVRPVWDVALDADGVAHAGSPRRVCYCEPILPTVWVDD